jgi:hypothetical protein
MARSLAQGSLGSGIGYQYGAGRWSSETITVVNPKVTCAVAHGDAYKARAQTTVRIVRWQRITTPQNACYYIILWSTKQQHDVYFADIDSNPD